MQTAPRYHPGLLEERGLVLSSMRSISSADELPEVHGITHDNPGTTSAEQGLSIHETGEGLVVGYHVVDTSIVPIAGKLESHAFAQQRTVLDGGKAYRMFGDPILYHHLNLATPGSGPEKKTPVWSFYFQDSQNGHPELIDVSRSVFVNSHESQTKEDLEALFSSYDQSGIDDPLLAGQYALSICIADHAQTTLEEHGWRMFKDERGRQALHRPLREWTDFKNLQFYSQTMEGSTPLYNSTQLDHMQRYAAGEKLEADTNNLKPDEMGDLMIRLLTTPNFRRREVSQDEYRQLVNSFFDEDEILLANIFSWAERAGYLTKEQPDDSNSPAKITFHNMPEKSIAVSPQEYSTLGGFAFAALHGLLKYRRQASGEKQAANRQMLRQLKLGADLSRSMGPASRKAQQKINSLVNPAPRIIHRP